MFDKQEFSKLDDIEADGEITCCDSLDSVGMGLELPVLLDNVVSFMLEEDILENTINAHVISSVEPTNEPTTKKKPATKNRQVVVTGLGVVSPVGHVADEFYENLLNGVSGISEIESFDCDQFPTRWVDKFILYFLTASKKPLEYGGVTKDVMKQLDIARCGVLIGSGMGGVKGWMGPTYSISTAYATSNNCIMNAANHIISGETDMMLSGEQNHDGFVMGEGDGVLLLGKLEHAKSQQYSNNQSSTNLSITYPLNDYQSSVYHNVYSPPPSIPQMEYALTFNLKQQQPEFPQLDSRLTVLVFKQVDDPIDAIYHIMSFLLAIITSRYPTTNNQLMNSSNPRVEIIPFVKALKEIFNTFNEYLIDDLTEVQNVFHQMDKAVEQHRLE
nr:3-oxoacyl-[acyl-carrier-protein] synthase II, chloroplastic-like [Tanacetum cinerariifolium]